jgi:hypothetical protein
MAENVPAGGRRTAGWTEWIPARRATCRKGWCAELAADESEWCQEHLDEVHATRCDFTKERTADDHDLAQIITERLLYAS